MTDPLTEIGLRAGTDKASWHGYTPYYHEILKDFVSQELFFLELGFGGYEYPDAGGESAVMWRNYSPSWDVAVIDIHEKDESLVPNGVQLYQGSQDDPALVSQVIKEHGRPTIVVDDASHISFLTNKSFEIIWPQVLPGGWYIVEDIGTSYLPAYGGNFMGNIGASVWNLGKNLIDNVMANSNFGKDHNILPTQPDLGIDVLHVMPNAIGIRKKHDS